LLSFHETFEHAPQHIWGDGVHLIRFAHAKPKPLEHVVERSTPDLIRKVPVGHLPLDWVHLEEPTVQVGDVVES